MVEVSDKQFEDIVGEAIDKIPKLYQSRLDNVAFIIEDDPSPQQRINLKLHCDQTLLGLYEGVPLPQRNGSTKLLPDKITIFKNPLVASSRDLSDLKKRVGHTVWHEVAHYYGLGHKRIHELDTKNS
ncbi:MAG TPA: metallopeptidase family protein [Candidatus Binatia bacterium]|nr:metallopeptidase family protein [Candidatus Binatia bacterium]